MYLLYYDRIYVLVHDIIFVIIFAIFFVLLDPLSWFVSFGSQQYITSRSISILSNQLISGTWSTVVKFITRFIF